MSSAEQLLAVAVVLATSGCALPLAATRPPGPLAAGWAVTTIAILTAWSAHMAPYEGPTIIKFTSDRGLTVVDLVVVPGLAVATAVLVRFRRG